MDIEAIMTFPVTGFWGCFLADFMLQSLSKGKAYAIRISCTLHYVFKEYCEWVKFDSSHAVFEKINENFRYFFKRRDKHVYPTHLQGQILGSTQWGQKSCMYY